MQILSRIVEVGMEVWINPIHDTNPDERAETNPLSLLVGILLHHDEFLCGRVENCELLVYVVNR